MKPRTRAIWVRKESPKCLVVHTVLKALETNVWYLDSCCSRHMSGDKAIFENLEDTQVGSVTFGDGSKARVLGKETMVASGLPKLDDALYVENLQAHLVSGL